MRDRPALLEAMLEDQARQDSIHRPGPYWVDYQQRTIGAIRKHGLERFRDRPSIGKGFADVVVTDPLDLGPRESAKTLVIRWLLSSRVLRGTTRAYRQIVESQFGRMRHYRDLYFERRFGDWLESALAAGDLPLTTHGGSRDTITWRGREYAYCYIRKLMRIHSFSKDVMWGGVRSVLEIGSGFGDQAHLFLSSFPNVRKICLVDIPPMIYVANQYLEHFWGDRSVVSYLETRDRSEIRFRDDDELEILCLCPWQLDRLRISVDVFWNAASFSEMTPEIVANYAGHVVRCLEPDRGRICLLLNWATPHPTARVTLPHEVEAAFGPVMELRRVESAIEEDGTALIHLVGRRVAVAEGEVAGA